MRDRKNVVIGDLMLSFVWGDVTRNHPEGVQVVEIRRDRLSECGKWAATWLRMGEQACVHPVAQCGKDAPGEQCESLRRRTVRCNQDERTRS